MQEIQSLPDKKDRKILNNFRLYCISRNLSLPRIIKQVRHIKILMQTNNLENITKNRLFRMIEKINNSPLSTNTKRDYKIAIRAYLKSIDLKHDLLDYVVLEKCAERIPKKLIKDPVWKNMETEKEKLFLRILQETGARPAEILNLKYSDIEYIDFYALITVTGKTGTRPIPLIDSAQMLMQNHRIAEPHEDYVFTFPYDSIRRKVSQMLKKEGYKDTYFYIFRKTKSTEWFSIYPNQIVKKLLGLTKNSRMHKHYDWIVQQQVIDIHINKQKSAIHNIHQQNLYNFSTSRPGNLG